MSEMQEMVLTPLGVPVPRGTAVKWEEIRKWQAPNFETGKNENHIAYFIRATTRVVPEDVLDKVVDENGKCRVPFQGGEQTASFVKIEPMSPGNCPVDPSFVYYFHTLSAAYRLPVDLCPDNGLAEVFMAYIRRVGTPGLYVKPEGCAPWYIEDEALNNAV